MSKENSIKEVSKLVIRLVAGQARQRGGETDERMQNVNKLQQTPFSWNQCSHTVHSCYFRRFLFLLACNTLKTYDTTELSAVHCFQSYPRHR